MRHRTYDTVILDIYIFIYIYIYMAVYVLLWYLYYTPAFIQHNYYTIELQQTLGV